MCWKSCRPAIPTLTPFASILHFSRKLRLPATHDQSIGKYSVTRRRRGRLTCVLDSDTPIAPERCATWSRASLGWTHWTQP